MTPVNAGIHTRENLSVLAQSEKRLLTSIARRLPAWVNSDHLSALGLTSMGVAGASFAAYRLTEWAALGVVLRVGEGERRSPRSAENQPAIYAELRAQALHVGDERRSRVVL